jgi:uncharacterized membrane protein YkvI
MSKAANRSILARVAAGLVMGSLTLALIGLATIVRAGSAETGRPLVQLILTAAAVATILIVVLSTTPRTTWGRLCLANGVVSIALAAASLQGRGQPLWSPNLLYQRALDQGTQWWLRHLMWTAAAYSTAAIVVAAVLFAVSYWLLRWPHRRHREAH